MLRLNLILDFLSTSWALRPGIRLLYYCKSYNCSIYDIMVCVLSAIQCDDGGASLSTGGSDTVCYAGNQCTLTLIAPQVEPNSVSIGHVLRRPDQDPLQPALRFLVRVILFAIAIPLMCGSRYELHTHSLCEPSWASVPLLTRWQAKLFVANRGMCCHSISSW